MIYIIGDSHVSVFSGTDKTHDGLRHIQPEFGTCYTLRAGSLRPHNVFEQRIPHFCPIKIGSNTAYNSFNKLPIIELAVEEYGITTNDYLFTCFGEIDIRNHIGFYVTEEKSLNDAIEETVDKYMKTVLYLKNKGLTMGVYGSPPSTVGIPPGSRVYSDVVTRNKMTLHFNGYLKKLCLENDIIFKDIAPLMMLPDGTTDEKKYMMDILHLSQGAMPLLLEEFNDIM